MSNSPTTKDIIKAILTNNSLNEDEKASLVEELMNEIKKEYPDLKYHATKADVKETELKLTKEIKEVELKLTQEIENTRKEIKEVDAKLTKEIKEVEGRLAKEIKELELKLNKEIKETKFYMLRWSFLFWITQLIAILSILFKLKG